jgi:hypothetical protein
VLFPLVARAGVLAEADSVLAAARSGRGTLVTVTGEPGIGKTRLAEAVADRAGSRAGRTEAERAEAFEFVWTWCPAAAGGAALGPWSRVVRTLAGGHAAAARLVDGSPFLAALAGRDLPAGGAPDPEGARSQLSFDLAEVIAAAAAQRPVLVIIDDAHQADPSSLRLLAELAPALRSMPAVVLVTARDGDQDWPGRLDERSALLRSGLVITLPPFAEDGRGRPGGRGDRGTAGAGSRQDHRRAQRGQSLAGHRTGPAARPPARQPVSTRRPGPRDGPRLRPGHHPRAAGRNG